MGKWREVLWCIHSPSLEFDALEKVRKLMMVIFTHGYSLGHGYSPLAF